MKAEGTIEPTRLMKFGSKMSQDTIPWSISDTNDFSVSANGSFLLSEQNRGSFNLGHACVYIPCPSHPPPTHTHTHQTMYINSTHRYTR